MKKEKQILLTRQSHQADRAGFHYDIRLVLDDKAYSYATKKDMPQPGKSIIIYEQPVHTAQYALSKKVVIPKGQYGAGTTVLDFVRKAKAEIRDDGYLLRTKDGERFLIKALPSYGEGAHLFFNITGKGKDAPHAKKASFTWEQYPQPSGLPITPYEKTPLALEEEARDETKSVLARLKAFLGGVLQEPQSLHKQAYVQVAQSETTVKKKTKQEEDAQVKKLDTTLSGQQHQNRVVEKLKSKHPRLLAYHGLGSGKTLTGLMAARQAQREGKRVTFITPAGLTKNVDKEQKKHKIQLDKKLTRILSYEMAAKKKDELLKEDAGLVVLDEAHKLRETETKRFKEIDPILQKAKSVLMLSGSPLYNEPKNLSTLVNTLAKDKVLPEDSGEFEQRYINKKRIDPGIFRRLFLRVKPSTRSELKNQDKLKSILSQYIDYYQPDEKQKAFYPKVNETEIKVPMSKEQQKVYDFIEGTLPTHTKWMVRMGLPPDKKSIKDLNSFASGLRQTSNTHGPFKRNMKPEEMATPKLERAISNLTKRVQEDKNFRGVVYSNYLKSGIEPYSNMLKGMGIKHEVITGELSARERAKIIKDYNSGKTKVLLFSSAAGEGIDLKGTKLVQVLEPHFNKSKIDQVVGRAVRYKSHEHLPSEERKVDVEHYFSTTRQTAIDKLFKINPKSIDEYLYERSRDKAQIGEQIQDLMKKDENSD
jgi:superfamily II DNA or RNA helicase